MCKFCSTFVVENGKIYTMKQEKTFSKIVLWVGLVITFTMAVSAGWLLSDVDKSAIGSLKWLQFLQTIGVFLLPALLGVWLWSDDHRPFRWLKMDRKSGWDIMVLAIVIMVCAIPGINLLAALNNALVLPDSMRFIEEYLRQMEEEAALLTECFLQADDVWGLFINVGLMALLPALAEEISFRGVLQQLLGGRTHVAIWLTAFIFSAIHMQFYGFVPRMLMGALFGYVFVWTGSLWVPIVMHFVNNGIAVLCYYILSRDGVEMDINYADTLGAGTTWWLGLLSLLTVILLLRVLYLCITSQGPRGYDRRTHKQ